MWEAGRGTQRFLLTPRPWGHLLAVRTSGWGSVSCLGLAQSARSRLGRGPVTGLLGLRAGALKEDLGVSCCGAPWFYEEVCRTLHLGLLAQRHAGVKQLLCESGRLSMVWFSTKPCPHCGDQIFYDTEPILCP